MTPARLTKGKNFQVVNLDRPFSNFSFVDDKFDGVTYLRRIFSQVRRIGCKTLIIEEIEGGDDILKENYQLENHPDVGRLTLSKTFRLSFFAVIYKEDIGSDDLHYDDFRGYAIFRIVESESGWICRWVYESVVRPSRIIE